jgi:amino acid transporter
VVTSVSVIGLYLSYIIPVYLAWRLRGTASEAPRGPWHLGRFGSSINLIAILWVVFITVILSIPDGLRAGKTIAGLTILLGAWYGLYERHRFHGPAWAAQQSSAALASHRTMPSAD